MKQEIKKVLDAFGVEYRDFGNRLTGRCPVHNGDNKTAFNIYDSGAWQCFTGGCHEKNPGLYGLVRLLLKKAGKPHSAGDIYSVIEKVPQFEGINFRFLDKPKKDKLRMSREDVLKRLDIPSDYFISRRFSPEILKRYDVGLCKNKKKRFYNRAVVPIYDIDYQFMVGCTGRTINDEQPKWLHDFFHRDNSLYNSWFAKDEIQRNNTCILVESPGNIWRLEEAGIHCGLAMYGTQLSFGQMRLLAQLGVLNIVLALDNDDAGKKATATIVERLKGLYNIVIPKIDYEDIAECPHEYLRKTISSSIHELLD